MTQPIDTAFVDIVPVDKSLEKLQRDIDRAMKKIDKEAEKDLKNIDKNFDKTFDQLNKYMDDMQKNAERHFRELDDIVENSLGDVAAEFEDTFTEIDRHFTKLGDDSDRAFRRTRSRFLEPLSAGLERVGSMVGDLGRAMFQLVSGVGGAIASNPLLSLILILTPAIIALAAALSQLIGLVALVPAGFGVMLAAILPMVVAFQNFGEAVSAIASGDLEKIDEALKKLSPSARAVAREIGALLPFLREFQKGIQEAFFSQIRGSIFNVIGAVLPAIRTNVESVVISMGRLVRAFAELVVRPETIQVFNELLAATARIISGLIGPLTTFAGMIGNSIQQALPFVERIAAAFGRALESFSAFVNTAIETGDFDQFIEDAITTTKELITLFKELGSLIGTIFGATEEEGHNFIKALTDMTVKLNDFLKTAEGQEALQLLVFTVKALVFTLSTSLDTLIFFWRGTQNMLLGLEMLGRGFVDLVTKIKDWFGSIPGAVTTFLEGLPEMVAGFFQRMFDRTLQIIGISIGLILFAIQELPNQIGAFLVSLPQRIYDWLVPIIGFVGQVFEGAVNFGKNFVVNGFNEIVAFIASVPERLRALMPNFNNAGSNLIQSFMNGFRAVGGFISDVAGDIVNSVKGFLNRAIDRINSGIATIDAILPGDLGRIPRLAEGALVRHRPGGILANVGEGSEDEVVAPLSKLEGMIGARQNITFGAGAVNVSFSGVVPSESEARRTGKAVGQGILDMISKRNIQLQVRAI